ncbi:hypothetical protein E2C01_036970 [Portunus trituberculatus]|uniref:Uncharacterized protein n=1 Tax=Portunus trituberculatus TaxID=210409 RepID=A0A5B7FDD2_PORTR|nr:hypothetical protein [Portunus trituberculatus]
MSGPRGPDTGMLLATTTWMRRLTGSISLCFVRYSTNSFLSDVGHYYLDEKAPSSLLVLLPLPNSSFIVFAGHCNLVPSTYGTALPHNLSNGLSSHSSLACFTQYLASSQQSCN